MSGSLRSCLRQGTPVADVAELQRWGSPGFPRRHADPRITCVSAQRVNFQGICHSLSHIELVNQCSRCFYLGNWKFSPQSRFNWNVRERSMELIGVFFCSRCSVMKLRVPSVYQ